MRLRKFIVYLTGMLLMLTGCSSIQMDTSITDRDVRVTDYLNRLIENEEYPGIQYMVLTENKVVYQYSGGYADISANINMDLSTRTYIYSINKIITAACILQLHEKGIINIDSSIQTYWPDIPYNVTIRQILCHTAGIPDPVWGNYYIHWPEEHDNLNRNTLLDKILAENPLQSEPGEKVSYSNLGYAILGRLIEIVTSDLFEDYVQKNIFYPLGISADNSSYSPLPESRLATFYIKGTSFIEGIMLGSLKGNTLTDYGNWKATRKAFILPRELRPFS